MMIKKDTSSIIDVQQMVIRYVRVAQNTASNKTEPMWGASSSMLMQNISTTWLDYGVFLLLCDMEVNHWKQDTQWVSLKSLNDLETSVCQSCPKTIYRRCCGTLFPLDMQQSHTSNSSQCAGFKERETNGYHRYRLNSMKAREPWITTVPSKNHQWSCNALRCHPCCAPIFCPPTLFCCVIGRNNLNSGGNSSSEYRRSEKYMRRMRQFACIWTLPIDRRKERKELH